MPFVSTPYPEKSEQTQRLMLAHGLLERRIGSVRLIDVLLSLGFSNSQALHCTQLAAVLLIKSKTNQLQPHAFEQALRLLEQASREGVLKTMTAGEILAFILAGTRIKPSCSLLILKKTLAPRDFFFYCTLVRFTQKAQLRPSALAHLFLSSRQFLVLAQIAAKTFPCASPEISLIQDIITTVVLSSARSPEPLRLLEDGNSEGGKLFFVLRDLAHFLIKTADSTQKQRHRSRTDLRAWERSISAALFSCGAARAVVALADPLEGLLSTRTGSTRRAILLRDGFAEGFIWLLKAAAEESETAARLPYAFSNLLFEPLSKESLGRSAPSSTCDISVCGHLLKAEVLSIWPRSRLRLAAQEIENNIAADNLRDEFHLIHASFPDADEKLLHILDAESLSYFFIECSRLPDAALWAPSLGAAGVLVCESNCGPLRNWCSERADFLKKSVADGFVFVLDRTPLLELLPTAPSTRKAAPAASLNLLAWSGIQSLLFRQLRKEAEELRALLRSEQLLGEIA